LEHLVENSLTFWGQEGANRKQCWKKPVVILERLTASHRFRSAEGETQFCSANPTQLSKSLVLMNILNAANI